MADAVDDRRVLEVTSALSAWHDVLVPDPSGGELLLCASGVGAFAAWATESLPKDGQVAFVDIAARPLDSPAHLDVCRATITGCALRLLELDLADIVPRKLGAVLNCVDAVFVAGGYPLYLLEWAQRSGFLVEVRDRVATGGLAYVGVSAGAALAGPDMSPLAASDDPGQVADTTGLGIVEFVVLPHADRRSAEDLSRRHRLFGDRFHLRPLRDDLALVVSAGGIREVPSP